MFIKGFMEKTDRAAGSLIEFKLKIKVGILKNFHIKLLRF